MVLLFFIIMFGGAISLVYLAFEYHSARRISSSNILSVVDNEMLRKELRRVRRLEKSAMVCIRKIENNLLKQLCKHPGEDNFSSIYDVINERYKETMFGAEQAISNLFRCLESVGAGSRAINSALVNDGQYEDASYHNQGITSSISDKVYKSEMNESIDGK